jgi:DNA-directed RNA polymerase specialized sigma24 family protein
VTFEEFARAQVQPLLRLATAMCGDASTAQDLSQDVLIATVVMPPGPMGARV